MLLLETLRVKVQRYCMNIQVEESFSRDDRITPFGREIASLSLNLRPSRFYRDAPPKES